MAANEIVERSPTLCPITRSDFLISAQDILGDIAGQKIKIAASDFEPDEDGRQAFGWLGKAAGSVKFGDETVELEIVVTIKVSGSEDATP